MFELIQNHFSNNYPLYGGLIAGGIITYQLYDKKKYPVLPVLMGCFSGGCMNVVLNSRYGIVLCASYAATFPCVALTVFAVERMDKHMDQSA